VKIAVFAVLLQYLILHKIGLKCGYCGFNHGNIVVVRSYKKKMMLWLILRSWTYIENPGCVFELIKYVYSYVSFLL
jgi:hypothetical protein